MNQFVSCLLLVFPEESNFFFLQESTQPPPTSTHICSVQEKHGWKMDLPRDIEKLQSREEDQPFPV